MRTLDRLRPTRVAADIDELAGAVQFRVHAVRLDQRNHFPQFGDSAPRPVERQPHRGVLVCAPTSTESQFEAPVGEQVERRGLLREHGGHVVVDAEDAGTDAQRVGHRGRGGHRRDRREVLSRSARGTLRRPGPEVVVRQEQR
jgi:hypothetical protein